MIIMFTTNTYFEHVIFYADCGYPRGKQGERYAWYESSDNVSDVDNLG